MPKLLAASRVWFNSTPEYVWLHTRIVRVRHEDRMEEKESGGTPFVIAGDWHGDTSWARAVVKTAAAAGVKRIFHVGDLAVLWPGAKKGRFDQRLNTMLEERGMDLVFIDGNHDNHTELRTLPIGDDRLARVRSHILYLPRGERIEYVGLTIGGLGGAFSVDCEWRAPGKDWWPRIEEVEPQDVDKLVAGGSVDILLTHDVPANFAGLTNELRNLSEEVQALSRVSRALLQDAVDALKPPHVFCGHWHQRRIGGISHENGSITRVDVLHCDGSRPGNAVLVWPGTPPLRVEPLIIQG